MEVEKLKVEGHTHTELCPHGSGEATEKMVQRAIELGFEEYCITEHAPLPKGFERVYEGSPEGIIEASLSWNQLDDYIKLVRALQKKYCNVIKISLGFEVDYLPGFEDQIRVFLDEYGPLTEQNILSVHFMCGANNKFWCLDLSPEDFEKGFSPLFSNPQLLYCNYFELVKSSLEADLGEFKPQRIGHMSLIKKYQDYFGLPEFFNKDTMQLITQIIKLIKNQGRQLDFNTAGMYKTYCNEFYPGGQICRLAYKNKIPLIYGSDAHSIAEVGRGYHLKNLFSGLDR